MAENSNDANITDNNDVVENDANETNNTGDNNAVENNNTSNRSNNDFEKQIAKKVKKSKFCLLPGPKNTWQSQLLKSKKLVLCVDLDETILQSSFGSTDYAPDFYIGNDQRMIFMRPYWQTFLTSIAPYYELVITTYSTTSYAKQIAEKMDPDKMLFKDRVLTKCDMVQGTNLRKVQFLRYLEPVEESMIIMIDDKACVWPGKKNVLVVPPFNPRDRKDPNFDDELSPSMQAASNFTSYLELIGHQLLKIHETFFRPSTPLRK